MSEKEISLDLLVNELFIHFKAVCTVVGGFGNFVALPCTPLSFILCLTLPSLETPV